jgi:hypothetical protein
MGGKEDFSSAIMNEMSGWSAYDGALNSTITGGPRNSIWCILYWI